MKATDPASIPPECVVRYASYLKDKYKNMHIFPEVWPLNVSTDQKYSKLSIIRNSKNDCFRDKTSTMEHDYIHGYVDNITAVKESIEIHEVFYPIINKTTGESRLTILMDGAPGVGKTTITSKLCQDWANGEILQEYHLVILIPVRFVELDKDSKISELFQSESNDLTDHVASYYVNEPSNMGKRILFILDGYDEANAQSKTEQSLLSQLIFGQVLCNCSVLVTSRPYASGYLKSHTRINRHVEVLGFSLEQIIICIWQNLADTSQAERLLQLLKDRLDIVSLCYIPLNCTIVLFVYKHLDYKLPETLTELYKAFILHTVKHHEEKREPSFDSKDEIRAMDCLDELPPTLTKDLNSLCKLAYDGIQHGKLSFNAKQLKLKSSLSLGLMNSYESITSVNVQKHFLFLHLTIQEFLAARYLATLPNDRLIDFVRSNLEKPKYRMVLLFVAGLTNLQFVPHGESLASIVEPPLTDPQYTERLTKRELIIFLAQMFYESQLPSAGNLLPIESNKLDFSGHPLSKFEELVIAHYLSSTAEDHRWEEINLVNSDIKHIIDKYHRINYYQLSIGMTESLHVGPVDVESLFPVLMQGLKELYIYSAHNIDNKHRVIAGLCTLIATHHHVEKVLISGDFSLANPIELSRETVRIFEPNLVCSYSFTRMLQFLNSHKPVSIICPYQEHILTDCSECEHSGEEAHQQLIAKLAGDQPISCLYLSRCNLSSDTIYLVVDKIVNRLTNNIIFEELGINGNDLTALPMKNLVFMLTRGISLSAYGFCFQPHADMDHLKVIDYSASYKQYKHLVETFHVPNCFTSVDLTTRLSDIRFIPIWFVTYFLFRNQNILKFSLRPITMNFCVECTCKETLDLAETIKSHKCLECLMLPQLIIKRNSLRITTDKIHDSLTKMCTNALGTLLDFLNEKTDSVYIENLPNAFQDCGNCQVATSTTVNKLLKLIAKSKKLQKFSISNCQLSEEQISLIATSIPTSLTLLNLTGNITNRATVNKVLALAEFNLVELYIDGFTFKVNVYTSCLHIECCKDHEPQCFGLFSTLIFPPKLKLIRISNTVKFNLASVVCLFLRNNPQIEDITLGSVETPLACGEAIALADSLNKHTSLQRLSFYYSQENLITRSTLLICGLKLCPMLLQKLLMFLDSEQTEKIDLVDEYSAFQDCQHCGASTAGVVTTFLDVIDQSKKLKRLDVTNCQLPADVVASLVTKLLDLPLLEFVSLKNNEVDEQSYIRLLRLFSSLNFQQLQLTDTDLCSKNSHGCSCLSLPYDLRDFLGLLYFSHPKNTKIYCVLHLLESMVNVPLRHKGIHISGAELTSDHVDLMKKLICDHETVCSISLDLCMLTSEFAISLSKNINSTQTLKELHLKFMDCSELLLQILNAIRSSSIEGFYFSLASDKAPKNSKDLGMSLCALIKHNKYLRTLMLRKCNSTIFNCISIAIAESSTLQSLYMYYLSYLKPYSCYESVPRLQEEDSKELGKSIDLILASQSLSSLNLMGIYFDEIVMSHLVEGLTKNKNIQTLTLKSLKLPLDCDSQIWTTLFEALEQNTTLHTLSIKDNEVGNAGFAALIELLDENKSLSISYTIADEDVTVEYLKELEETYGGRLDLAYCHLLED